MASQHCALRLLLRLGSPPRRLQQRQRVPEGGDVGQVEDTVQVHVDDGDVQVAEGVCAAEANTTAPSTLDWVASLYRLQHGMSEIMREKH